MPRRRAGHTTSPGVLRRSLSAPRGRPAARRPTQLGFPRALRLNCSPPHRAELLATAPAIRGLRLRTRVPSSALALPRFTFPLLPEFLAQLFEFCPSSPSPATTRCRQLPSNTATTGQSNTPTAPPHLGQARRACQAAREHPTRSPHGSRRLPPCGSRRRPP